LMREEEGRKVPSACRTHGDSKRMFSTFKSETRRGREVERGDCAAGLEKRKKRTRVDEANRSEEVQHFQELSARPGGGGGEREEDEREIDPGEGDLEISRMRPMG
jgi:hypothetical protein